MTERTPCIVITRDRVSHLRRCLASLERFRDQLDIYIVDHGSTYPDMINWLDHENSHVTWHRGSRRPRDLWTWDVLWSIVGGDQPYLVTDPDVVLDDACPDDWLDRMRHEMGHDPDVKVGLGLRLDDLPDTPMGARARDWERAFWLERTECGHAWKAPVDTTLALYPPLSVAPEFRLAPGKRLDTPYLLRHLPWYGEFDPDEARYYREHALSGSSHWADSGEGWPTA